MIDRFSRFYDALLREHLDMLFVLAFVVICLSYSYPEFLFESPKGFHTWRQTDCASMAWNYGADDLPLLRPQMHYQMSEDFCGFGEFPILFYIVGKLYSIFGFHEWIYRSVWLIFSFIGSFCLYRIAFETTHLKIESLLTGLIFLTSPLLAFYGISFISDPIALYLLPIATFLLLRAKENERPTTFYLSVSIFALAGLIKITELMLPMALLILGMFHGLSQAKRKMWMHSGIGLMIILLINAMWYAYAIRENDIGGIGYFFTSTSHYWREIDIMRAQVYDMLYNTHLRDFHNDYLLFFTLSTFVLAIPAFKRHKWPLLLLALLIIALTVYFFAFFYQFHVHDYYVLPFLSILPLSLIIALKSIQEVSYWKYFKIVLPVAFLVITFLGKNVARTEVDFRFRHVEGNESWYDDYLNLSKELEGLGVGKDDMVISISDPSPNITLYFLKRKGWSNLYHSPMNAAEMEMFSRRGAKFLFLGADSLLNREGIDVFLTNKIGEYQGIEIYKF